MKIDNTKEWDFTQERKRKKFSNLTLQGSEAVPKLQLLEQPLSPGENCRCLTLYAAKNWQLSPGACFI
jgi:hypothetical protein